MIANNYQEYRTVRVGNYGNRSLLVEFCSPFPRYIVLFLFVCVIISATEPLSAASLHDLKKRSNEDLVVARENEYYAVAAAVTSNQRIIRLRHVNGAAGRKLVNVADFKDPKSVELKNQYNEVTSMQPPLQLRGAPSSMHSRIEEDQRSPQPILNDQPQDFFQVAAASKSEPIQLHHQQKNGIDYYTNDSTPSEFETSYLDSAEFTHEDSIRISLEGNLGGPSTPIVSMRGADIAPLLPTQGLFPGINNEATKSQPFQNQQQQLIIQHPLTYSQGTIASKVYETHEVKRSNEKLLLQEPKTTIKTDSKLSGVESHSLHLPNQESGLQHPLKYPQTYPTETEQSQLQIRPPELGDDNSISTFRVAHGPSNLGSEGDIATIYQEQALNYQSLPEVYSKSAVGGQRVQSISNESAISLSLDRSQKTTMQVVPQNSQASIDDSVFQAIPGSQQYLKAQAVGSFGENSNSQTANKPIDVNIAAASNHKQPSVNFGLEGFRDTWDLPLQINDLPVFWKIPRSGGQTVVDILGQCHRFVMATDVGTLDGHGQDSNITVLHIAGDGGGATSYVNVDTTTTLGLQRAKRLGLVQSEIARVIVVKNIFDANELFDEHHRGRLFALFRHPIDRAISTYNYLKYADWDPTYNPEIADMTLKQYAQSKLAESNWMTRALSSAGTRNVTEEHLKAAMDIIRRKFLVGLLNRKDESMERYEKYFEWIYRVHPKNQEKCRVGLLAVGSSSNINRNKVEKPLPGTPTYQLLVALNEFDIRLYKYVESLFDEQANFVKLKEDGFRLDGASCCKCDKSC